MKVKAVKAELFTADSKRFVTSISENTILRLEIESRRGATDTRPLVKRAEFVINFLMRRGMALNARDDRGVMFFVSTSHIAYYRIIGEVLIGEEDE